MLAMRPDPDNETISDLTEHSSALKPRTLLLRGIRTCSRVTTCAVEPGSIGVKRSAWRAPSLSVWTSVGRFLMYGAREAQKP